MERCRFFITRAQTGGFCWGVKHALGRARELRKEQEADIEVWGELVHNQHVVEGLRQEGIRRISDLGESEGNILLITAHGRSPEDTARARKIAERVEDLTCPIVKRQHRAARKLQEEGRKMILIGVRTHAHPEVQGTVGVLRGEVIVIESLRDIELVPYDPSEPVGIVAQTTFNGMLVSEIVDLIRMRYRDTKYIPTVCDDIARKQEELRSSPALGCNMVVVVGDRKSANTTHLAEIAAGTLNLPTLFVLDARELEGMLERSCVA